MNHPIRLLIESFLADWNARDGDAVASRLTPDVEYVDLALGAHFSGAEAVGAFAVSMSSTFSTDAKFALRSILIDGDDYAYEWTLRGTNDVAGAGGMPRTGARFALEGVSVGRVHDGRIARNRDHWDLGSYLRQVGLLTLGAGDGHSAHSAASGSARPSDGLPR